MGDRYESTTSRQMDQIRCISLHFTLSRCYTAQLGRAALDNHGTYRRRTAIGVSGSPVDVPFADAIILPMAAPQPWLLLGWSAPDRGAVQTSARVLPRDPPTETLAAAAVVRYV